MPGDPRTLIKRMLPARALDRVLLSVPWLYTTRLVNYETNLDAARVAVLVSRVREVREVAGDVIECGSSRGGSAVIIARTLRQIGASKTVFACDSFSGFDRAELRAERAAGLTDAPDDAFTSTSLAYITRKLEVLGLADTVTPVAGYFESTLPKLDTELSFAFIDCDLRDSVAYCAEQLWPRLSPGGQMLFDDYQADGWGGAARGVRDFLDDHAATVCSHGERSGMYWAVKGDREPAT
jgi:predicted O-methyltransferase YrrM